MLDFLVKSAKPRLVLLAASLALGSAFAVSSFGQAPKKQQQSGLSDSQRLNVMRSKLDTMKRSLESGVAAIAPKDPNDKTKSPDDPREWLRGLLKEVNAVDSDVSDLRSKEDRAEKYDSAKIDELEASVADLTTRVESGLQATAGARADDRIHRPRCMRHVMTITPDRNIPNAGRDEVVLDVEGRDGSILFQVATERNLLTGLAG